MQVDHVFDNLSTSFFVLETWGQHSPKILNYVRLMISFFVFCFSIDGIKSIKVFLDKIGPTQYMTMSSNFYVGFYILCEFFLYVL